MGSSSPTYISTTLDRRPSRSPWPNEAIYCPKLASHGSPDRDMAAWKLTPPVPGECRK
jgi:hypothetical protein